ncbi:MAG TPA: Uma2 family endonuclease [Acidobacteriaceae bacterium]|nr:Uma2 family endonuclease [Acidobacteriaceae bacterium]
MATAPALISIEEYLATSYHPDCDYVDGDIQERNLGEREHARLQAILTGWFGNNEKVWNVSTLVEQRIRVTSGRVRIADICLISRDAPREQVTLTPPLLCVEILSPEDRLPRAACVMEDYARMGVSNLWLLDPKDRVAYIYASDGLFKLTTDRLTIPDTEIYVDLTNLFAALD